MNRSVAGGRVKIRGDLLAGWSGIGFGWHACMHIIHVMASLACFGRYGGYGVEDGWLPTYLVGMDGRDSWRPV